MDRWKAVQRSEGAPCALAAIKGGLGAKESDGSRLFSYIESAVSESSLFLFSIN